MAGVRIDIDTGALTRILAVNAQKAVFIIGKRVEGEAKKLCPVNTGRLRSSIGTTVTTLNGLPAARVGTDVEYARQIHDGTGIYGPHRTPVVPRRGKYLVFNIGGQTVFARSVRGVKGRPFLTDALRKITGAGRRV